MIARLRRAVVIATTQLACTVALSVSAAAQTTPSPWFGTWKLRLKAADEKPETLIYSDAGDGAMRMVSVEENSVIVTRFDGRPAADVGTKANNGRTLAIKAVSPISYTWTFSLNGKPHVNGVNTLSAGRKSFTEVSWLVTKPGETVTQIYERQ